MTARPDVTTPRTSDRRLVRPPQVSGVTPEQLRAWRAAADACGMKLAAWIRAACDAAIAPAAPPNAVREEDDTGVRFVDRSQAMLARNTLARETWNLGTRRDLPVPPEGSGCLVYNCWTPCAPGHECCARHGGKDAIPPRAALEAAR